MIDAACIREVLERHRNGLSRPSKELLSRINDLGAEIDALLRDLDAQGPAQAGWRPTRQDCDAAWKKWSRRFGSLQPADNRQSFDAGFWNAAAAAPAGRSPAHALEACIADLEAEARSWDRGGDEDSSKGKTHAASRLWGTAAGLRIAVQRLRALTSAAEEAERPPSIVDKTDAWDEEHIKRRSIIRTPEGFKAIDRETTRPLSEWSDDELFRRIGKAPERWTWKTSAGAELRKRGWRPWAPPLWESAGKPRPWHGSDKAESDHTQPQDLSKHGSDKAPVEDGVEARLRDGRHIKAPAAECAWNHTGIDLDIIAYRPVPAKAESAADAGEVERLRLSDIKALRNAPLSNIPHGDGMRLVGFRLPEDVAGLSDGLFMMDRLRAAALRPAPSEEQVERAADAITAFLCKLNKDEDVTGEIITITKRIGGRIYIDGTINTIELARAALASAEGEGR